jgi:hypothetical protein
MKRRPFAPSRRAATLVELMLAMAAGAALLAGMASTMGVAVRACDPKNTPAAGLIETAECVADVAAEFQFATAITEMTVAAVTITVPDRNNDATPETIRYAWAGAGQPLTRSYNGGAAATQLSAVQSAVFTLYPSSAAPVYATLTIQRTTDATTTVETSFPVLNL